MRICIHNQQPLNEGIDTFADTLKKLYVALMPARESLQVQYGAKMLLAMDTHVGCLTQCITHWKWKCELKLAAA